jgi:hypothetical protein
MSFIEKGSTKAVSQERYSRAAFSPEIPLEARIIEVRGL